MLVEFHIDNGADDPSDAAHWHVWCGVGHFCPLDLLSGYSASAPEMISVNSLVIIAWRERLYCKVCFLIISPALREALSIALIRAPCSEAAFSRRARNNWIAILRGRSEARISSPSGSYS